MENPMIDPYLEYIKEIESIIEGLTPENAVSTSNIITNKIMSGNLVFGYPLTVTNYILEKLFQIKRLKMGMSDDETD